MTASGQIINGNMLVDDISTLNLYLKDKSAFNGAINCDGQSGDVYVEIEDGSTWTLTADSYVSALTVGEGSAIDLKGHKLYVNGKEYEAGAASTGEAFDINTSSGNTSSGNGGGAPDGMQGEAPDVQGGPGGDGQGGPAGNGTPPDKPNGSNGDTPPDKPDGDGQGGPGGNPPSGNPPSGDPPEKPDPNN